MDHIKMCPLKYLVSGLGGAGQGTTTGWKSEPTGDFTCCKKKACVVQFLVVSVVDFGWLVPFFFFFHRLPYFVLEEKIEV